MKNTRKGFTIVELVIVIAVVAILAAVLIPTFVSLVNKANVANDTALVKNLNTALAADSDGCKTMSEALAAAADFGYDIAKINAKGTNNEILWDSVNNVFCYFDSEKNDITYIPDYEAETETADIDFWVIASTPSTKYSTYLYNYNGDGAVTVSTGLDVGACGITSIVYNGSANGQEVVIVTNNAFTNLKIDAINDEVVHYGELGNLDIVAVKKGSYNEHGCVGGIVTLTYGKINVKENGEIATIIATPVNAADVVLSVEGEGKVGTVIATDAAVVETLTVAGVTNTEVVATDAIETVKNSACYIKGETNVYYETLQDAVDAANGETTIVVLKDLLFENVDSAVVTINQGKNITLDLNGHIIEAQLVNTKSVNLIKVSGSTSGEDVYAELKIVDSTADETGIGRGELRTTEVYNSDPMDVSASVISIERNGKVTVESGKIVNNNKNCAWGAYAIDVLTNTGAQNTWLTINGGLVESNTYRAIRGFCNSTTGTVYVTVNGGVVRSGNNNAIWMQDPSEKVVNLGVLTITGGTIESNGYYNGVDRFPITIGAELTVEATGGKFVQNGADVTSTYVK